MKNPFCASHYLKGLLVKEFPAPDWWEQLALQNWERVSARLPEGEFSRSSCLNLIRGWLTPVSRPSERNTQSLSFPLKATHDLIKYEVGVMDGFISKRQHPSEIPARPGLQMDS